MKQFRNMLLPLLIMLIGLSSFFVSEAKCDHEEYKKKMIQSWKKRSEVVKTLRVKWLGIDFNKDEKNRNQLKSQQSTFILGASGKTYLEIKPVNPPGKKLAVNKNQEILNAFSYNGKRNFSLTLFSDKKKWPIGIVWSDEKNDEIHNVMIRPWLLHVRPFLSPVPDLSIDKLKVIETDAKIDNHKCTIVEWRDSNSPVVGIYYIDTERDYSILSFQELHKNRVTVELNIDYQKNSKLGWFPKEWNASFANGRFSTSNKLLSYEINPEVSASTFEIKYPVGAIVFDRDLGYRSLYLKNGKKHRITDKESTEGFNYQELLNSGSDK